MLRTTIPPAARILTLAEAKAHLRVDHPDENSYIEGLIVAAERDVERATQRRYIAAAFEWILPAFCFPRRLPIAPFGNEAEIEIVTIDYVDSAGALQSLDPADYVVFRCGATAAIRWSQTGSPPALDPDAAEPVLIGFTFSGAAADVPPAAKQAALLLIGQWYDRRTPLASFAGEAAPLPNALDILLTGESWS